MEGSMLPQKSRRRLCLNGVILREKALEVFEREDYPSANSSTVNLFPRYHSVEGPQTNAEHLCRLNPANCQTFHAQPPAEFLLQGKRMI
jgi:hypothetical protein